MATTQVIEELKDIFPKKITVGSEPVKILFADPERKPLIVRRIDRNAN